MQQLFDIILNLDTHLASWVALFGPWIYLILFMIIFAETGLVVTPFLPGDSLLFAVGAVAAVSTETINIHLMAAILILAALIGDLVNYHFGKHIGPRVFSKNNSKLFNPNHLQKTQKFYEKYGAKTIVIARFAPIIRTFAPFVAGIGKMQFSKFFSYSVFGAVSWVTLFLYTGFYFGNLPSIKKNFHVVIFIVIGLSLLPIFIEWYKSARAGKKLAN